MRISKAQGDTSFATFMDEAGVSTVGVELAPGWSQSHSSSRDDAMAGVNQSAAQKFSPKQP